MNASSAPAPEPPQSRFGWAAVAAGIEDEDRVADALRRNGYGVVPFGQRVWDPTTCESVNDDLVIGVVRRSRLPLRHAPDLLAARGDRGPVLVEVVNSGDREQRAMEIAKLSALDAWRQVAPVVIVDVGSSEWTAWPHLTGWPYLAATPVTRYTRNGSGDPYAWFARSADRPFREVFGVQP